MNRHQMFPNYWHPMSSMICSAPFFVTFRGWIVALVLLLPGPVPAADYACTKPTPQSASLPLGDQLKELDEVIVKPAKATSRPKALGAWLQLLQGQYTYDGSVDLCGHGNAADLRPVTGKADCAAIYNYTETESPTSVYCVIDVRWPLVQGEGSKLVVEGESRLSPAMVVFGVVPDLPGIQFMEIDSKGMTTHAKGKLVGDTLTARGTCGAPSACQKVTRISAHPDSNEIAMLIDIDIDSTRTVRHRFLLHRVSNIPMKQSRKDLLLIGER